MALASRQVHLDFHTSEHLPDIGKNFDKQQFQDCLQAANLNSITIFAKGHHSWCYYPTKAGAVHPNLDFDLMGEQIKACHEIGVKAPVYITVGWSATDAANHPEWHVRRKDGKTHSGNFDIEARPEDPIPNYAWITLCPDGGYKELILAQTQEVVDNYPVDGLFYDICAGPVCYCDTCRQGMAKEGVDVDDEDAARAYNVLKWQRFMDACRELLFEKHPDATIFFNGIASISNPAYVHHVTHFELEDLPTTWGGYDKFPIRAKFFAGYGKDYMAMSGKFHKAWGEFGGFKHPDAIRYEAASMIAWGARCSFGDQLHPVGEMDVETYRNIGDAYRYVELIENFGLEGQSFANLGLLLSGRNDSDFGLGNILLEKQIDFDVVHDLDKLEQFDTIIVPDHAFLSEDDAAKLREFAEEKSLLLIADGALNQDKDKFLFDFGADFDGHSSCDKDYLIVDDKLKEGVVKTPFLNYEPALRSKVTDGQGLGQIREPYFNRTYGHYCSHCNTPYKLENAPHPAAVRKGNILWLAHPLCRMYHNEGARVHREYFYNALQLVYRQPVLIVTMPSAGRVNLIHQPQHKRYVAHLLYASPIKRGNCSVIEDMPPLHNVPVDLKVPEKINKVKLMPHDEEVDFDYVGPRLRLTVPEMICHQMVVFEYA